jgi:hypothetical protein
MSKITRIFILPANQSFSKEGEAREAGLMAAIAQKYGIL